MKNYKPVIIEWVDSKGSTSGWEHLEDVEPILPAECASIGFLFEDKKEYKTLLQSVGSGQILGRITIPTRAIKRITKLR